MKTSAQLKALIRNLSKEKSVQAEIILRNFMLERLLERISLSPYRDKFILKGGMLVAAMVGIDTRSTMDMDATIKGLAFSEEALEEALKVILQTPVDDSVTMTLKGFENIRDKSDYPGIRVSIESVLDKTRQVMKVDFTTGDSITPRAVEYSFRLLFENRNISILAYNLETVLSEKLESILLRSTANTRMRDYYDVYILTTLRNQDINWDLFSEAFKNTAEKRGSYSLLLETRHDRMGEIEQSQVLTNLWSRYQQKNNYAVI
ncbi:nucleotidyl transferase AbiEii/AbiGii toxin family protein [Desulfoscipio sp. XC116]|uniref:nucleotidyl transferase AbiEii/AbiGii toxin family protein n=1 Tax=Desulfoscipio sp. XC116 TaxID=3144975 RepID=UPI00325B42E3